MNSRMRFFAATVVLLVVMQPMALAQTLDSGPQVLTFFSEVDDTEQPYALYLPPNFDAAQRYPLVVSLHGAGSNHRLNLRRVFGKSNAEGENDVEASRYFPAWEAEAYIVVSPYARGTMGYQGVAEKDVWEMLADVQRRFSIDENRIYLTGLSMGGGGTLWLGLTRPDVWAAIAPVCPAPPQGTEALAPNALNLPVHIFQGGADPVVRPEGVRAWVERLKEAGAQVEYEEYPGVMHDSWVQAYEDGQIFDWFAQHERNPFPERVRFVSDRYANDTAYWVQLGALTPGTLASIDAQFTAPNQIAVTTSELDGFTLHLVGHPSVNEQEPLRVEIDGTRLEVSGEVAPAFHRKDGAWVVGSAAEQGKRPGLEGPMREAVADRHVYVFGTAGDPSPEEREARRAQAMKAAEWSVNRGPFWGRVMVFPRVVSDREVRPSDHESAHLVLFGTKETNSVIAQLADRLPLHFEGDAAAYGLVYVYPVDGRYVLINSGLPWWQTEAGMGNPFTSGVVAFGLAERGDFLLFKENTENVIAEGRFDRNWQLPTEAADAMQASGVVVTNPVSGSK